MGRLSLCNGLLLLDCRSDLPGRPMNCRPERKIRLNDKWRQELGEDELKVFARTAGRLNAGYGYKP